MTLEQILTKYVTDAVEALYGFDASAVELQFQKTREEFEGNITLVVFPLVKVLRRKPQDISEAIGEYLVAAAPQVLRYNAVQGFLNLVISDDYWLNRLSEIAANEHYGERARNGKLMMVEYSSPNTNKPLHLGHVRNNLLGYSISKIQQANGWEVIKTNIVNDRGIHICKSMLAWELFGNGETPESTGKKGDHLIGDYYVRFDVEYKKQVKELMEGGMDEESAKREAPLMKQAQQMLVLWEQGDEHVRNLWAMMNSWVYAGFDETYKALGVSFDKIYYESDTYLVGKREVERGLAEGKFYRREDNSVWADLRQDGLDEKLLLRQDGTSVYMTQDIGTAKLRYEDYEINKMVYVVGNEQEYHFKVLSLLLDRLGFAFGKDLVHFSYGMVELPEGKMKSREGTVVDADDLIEKMVAEAKQVSSDKVNRLTDITEAEAEEIARKVGLGALKYFILKVDPHKNMLFNPQESIDFNGNTGPFIQYTYARIKSVLRKAGDIGNDYAGALLNEKEQQLIQLLTEFEGVVKQAGDDFSPAVIANYAYKLACEYNSYYHDYSILGENDERIRRMRVLLSAVVARTLCKSMSLLGIEMPERM